MIAIQQSERNGKVVAATLEHADDEIMLTPTRACWCAPAWARSASWAAPRRA